MPMPPHRSPPATRRPRLGAAGCAALALAALGGCGQKPQGLPPAGPAEVVTIKVAPQDVPVASEYVGQTQSSQAVTIAARVSGFLDKRTYVEGSVVRAGQVLFQMDPKPFQAQVDGAQAALSRQQAAYDVASANLKRVQPLVAQNALSQKDLDDAKGQYEQAGAAVEQAKSQLEEAKLNLSYTTITSPVNGVSSFAAVADGTYVNAQNSQLTTVSVLSPMWINFSISENQYERVRNDVTAGRLRVPDSRELAVEIVLVDGSVYPYRGRITFADPSYNSQTGTFLLRATVDNPQGVLRPNQYVRARLHGATRPDAILVPQRAVQQGAKGHYVWVVNAKGEAELRPVTMGDWNGDNWIVTQGLAAGDVVVVDGGQRLGQGAPVKVRSALPPIVPVAGPAPPPQRAGEKAAASGKASGAGVAAVMPATKSAGAAATAPPAASAPAAPPAAARAPSAASGATAVYFAPGSASLDANAMQVLRLAAAQAAGAATLDVTGHVDRNGARDANVELAKRRATAVRDALVAAGVPADRVRLKPPADIVGSGPDAEARRVDVATSR